MALYWTIDSRLRLMTVVGDGLVTRDNLADMLDAMAMPGVNAYRKLVDGLGAEVRVSGEEAFELATRVRLGHQVSPPGPLAMVLPPTLFESYRTVFGMLAAADRPFRMFETVEKGRRWIESPAVLGWQPPPPGAPPLRSIAAPVSRPLKS